MGGCCGSQEPAQNLPSTPSAITGASAVSPQYVTGRQYVGGAGFDSPFDAPEIALIPIAAPVKAVMGFWARITQIMRELAQGGR